MERIPLIKPADYFLQLDEVVLVFKSKTTSLYWKVFAAYLIFLLIQKIVQKAWHRNLILILFSVEPQEKAPICKSLAKALDLIHQHMIRADFFPETFAELQEIHEVSNEAVETVIASDEELNDLMSDIGLLVAIIKQHPFKKMIVMAYEYRKNGLLFKAFDSEELTISKLTCKVKEK